ncbi:CPBP family intramembrane glutamic endopeptidase [Treponema bryantii]|uniref:CPBP family intramembrane glutamic endopeptidase n=1 Tax=Treponema bryantii TaxID=163 RepID=UPI0012DEB056|nr:CPBP family intramembrane glutamic endopeptidase [Treponema bryantii]
MGISIYPYEYRFSRINTSTQDAFMHKALTLLRIRSILTPQETPMNRFVRFNFTKDTAVAFGASAVMIFLSLIMLLFGGDSLIDKAMSFILRDLLMIFGLGIVFVSLYVGKKAGSLKALGFTGQKNALSLLIDFLLAAGLLAMFLKDEKPAGILEIKNLYAATYILVAGIFEMTFIYGYLRASFEKAFGIIPAILLTAAFYSFHHAGFQPEFLHLFFVGLMYCSVYYITQNLLIIFPFFWGVGALWDVIVSSEAGEEIKNLESFIIALIILVLSVGWIFISKKRLSGQAR